MCYFVLLKSFCKKKIKKFKSDLIASFILLIISPIISFINCLSANPTKLSNTLKQIVGKLPTNCLNVFDLFVGLAPNGLKNLLCFVNAFSKCWIYKNIYSVLSILRVHYLKEQLKLQVLATKVLKVHLWKHGTIRGQSFESVKTFLSFNIQEDILKRKSP